jgi:hypothetical protein
MVAKSHKFIPFLGLFLIAVTILAACSSPAGQKLAMASLDGMPAEVHAAPAVVQQAYRFAVANPGIMKQIPCYCGCGSVGHTSNYSCYVTSVDSNGSITYDHHALGCSLCVDITQDTMRLLKQGKSAQEIKAYVDSTYSKYGQSNLP